MIFKIAASGISVDSRKKSYEAFSEFILSFRQARTEWLLYSKPGDSSTGGPDISKIQSCKQTAARWVEKYDENDTRNVYCLKWGSVEGGAMGE